MTQGTTQAPMRLSAATCWLAFLVAIAAMGGCGDAAGRPASLCATLNNRTVARGERIKALKSLIALTPRTQGQIDCVRRFIASDSDPQLRAIAMDAALDWDQDARHLAPALFSCLAATDSWVRERAAASYAFLESASAPALRRLRRLASDDPESGVRAAALNSLGMLGDARASQLLVRGLGDESPEVRLSAAIGLANLDVTNPTIVGALVVATEDPVSRVSVAAHMALGGKEPSGLLSGPVFLRATNSEVAELRMWAASGLGHLVQPASADEYVRVLAELLDSDANADVQRAAAGALGTYGAAAKPALDALRRAMDRGVISSSDSHAKISKALRMADGRD